MRVIGVILVQMVLAFFIAASTMPVLLATVPDVQNDRVGMITAATIFVVSFALIAIAWPARTRRTRPRADRP